MKMARGEQVAPGVQLRQPQRAARPGRPVRRRCHGARRHEPARDADRQRRERPRRERAVGPRRARLRAGDRLLALAARADITRSGRTRTTCCRARRASSETSAPRRRASTAPVRRASEREPLASAADRSDARRPSGRRPGRVHLERRQRRQRRRRDPSRQPRPQRLRRRRHGHQDWRALRWRRQPRAQPGERRPRHRDRPARPGRRRRRRHGDARDHPRPRARRGAVLRDRPAHRSPQFAQNIRDLRTAGCDIIVDDVFYYAESPFQDGQTVGVVHQRRRRDAGGQRRHRGGRALLLVGRQLGQRRTTAPAASGKGDFVAGGDAAGPGRRRTGARLRRRPELEPGHGRRQSDGHAALVGSARQLGQRLRLLHHGRRAHRRSSTRRPTCRTATTTRSNRRTDLQQRARGGCAVLGQRDGSCT